MRLYRQAVALGREASIADDLPAETLVEAWKSWELLLTGRRPALLGRAFTWFSIALLHLTAPSTPQVASPP